jgi:acetyltransferase-like isoleucine patch superfamily enzyme
MLLDFFRTIKYSIIDLIEFFGFIHRHRWYINGDADSLIIKDPKVNIRIKLGYSNALFNTRSGKITIGENVIFGHDCQILTGRHADNFKDPLKYKPTIANGFDIEIQNGVWLTSRVIVTGGVKIGENTTVLPGSIVTKNMPPNSIVGGMPARVLKLKSLID